MNRFVYLAIVFFLPAPGSHALPIAHTPVPGGVAVIELPDDARPSSVRYNGKRVMTAMESDAAHAIVGLPLYETRMLLQGMGYRK